MSAETYYFFFSIIGAIVAILHLIKVLYFRFNSKTPFGIQKKYTQFEEQWLNKFSSVPYLSAAALIVFLTTTNLLHDINRLLKLEDQEYARGLLIYTPVIIVVLFISTFIAAYRYSNRLNDRDK